MWSRGWSVSAALLLGALLIPLLVDGPSASALASGRCATSAGSVEQRIASFWQCVDALGGSDLLTSDDLGQWARNVTERDPGARISVAEFRASTAGMQTALESASAGLPPGVPKSPDVESRIAQFWQRIDALGPGDLLSAADLGQWALNVIDRDPNKRIRVDDFRASTAGMQSAIDRAVSLPRPSPQVTPTPAPAPTVTPMPPPVIPTATPTPVSLPPAQAVCPNPHARPAPPLTPIDPKLASAYPFLTTLEHVRVLSDISQRFSDDHAAHLELVWKCYASIFNRSRGDRIEAYYTLDVQKYATYGSCPTLVVPGARQLTACYSDIARWFIVPYTIPDFGTQQHEISHDFLFANYTSGYVGSAWFAEGTAMYWESGQFDTSGHLTVTAPLEYCTLYFKQNRAAGTLLPLTTLLTLSRTGFVLDQGNGTRTYSEACLLFHYLWRVHRAAMDSLIAAIDAGTITQNVGLINAITAGTGLTIAQLQDAYLAFASELIG